MLRSWLTETTARHNRAALELSRNLFTENLVAGLKQRTGDNLTGKLIEDFQSSAERLELVLRTVDGTRAPALCSLRIYCWRQLSIVYFNWALLNLQENDIYGAGSRAQISFQCIRNAALLRQQGTSNTSDAEASNSNVLDMERLIGCKKFQGVDAASSVLQWSAVDGIIAVESCLLLVALWLQAGSDEGLSAAEFWWEHAVEPVLRSVRDSPTSSNDKVLGKLGRAQVLETILRWRHGRLSTAYTMTLTGTPHAAYLRGICSLLLGDRQAALDALEEAQSQYRRDDAKRLLLRLQAGNKDMGTTHLFETTKGGGRADHLFRVRMWMQQGRFDLAIRSLPFSGISFSITQENCTRQMRKNPTFNMGSLFENWNICLATPSRGAERCTSDRNTPNAASDDPPGTRTMKDSMEYTEMKEIDASTMSEPVLSLAGRGAIHPWRALPRRVQCILLGSAIATALACAENWDECLSVCHQLQCLALGESVADAEPETLLDPVGNVKSAYRMAFVQLSLVYAEALLMLGFRDKSLKVLRNLQSANLAMLLGPLYGMLVATRHASLFMEALIDTEEPIHDAVTCIQETRIQLRLLLDQSHDLASDLYEYCAGIMLNAEALIALAGDSESNEGVLSRLENAVKRTRYHPAVVYNLTLFLWARMGQLSRALRLWLRHRGIDPDDHFAAWEAILDSRSAAGTNRDPFAAMTRACILLRRQQIADEQALQDLDFLKQIVA
jgi:tetratricopeptide (TPR) repeat protein